MVRAVEIGRRRKFWNVALRCRVAYSLEHYHSWVANFTLLETLGNKVIETAREPLSVGNYNIARSDASMGLSRCGHRIWRDRGVRHACFGVVL